MISHGFLFHFIYGWSDPWYVIVASATIADPCVVSCSPSSHAIYAMKKAQHVVRKGDGRELNRDATSKLGATEQYCGSRGYDAIEDDDDDDDDTATGAGFEEHVDTESPPATPNRLTVAKLPKLVREGIMVITLWL